MGKWIINIILGENRTYSEMSGHSDLYFIPEGDNLIIKVDSDIDVSGLQLSFYTDHVHTISLNDNSDDVYTASNVNEGIQYFVGFSMENNPFDKLTNLIALERNLEISANEFEGVGIQHPLWGLMKFYFKSKNAICFSTGINIRKNMGKKYELEWDHIFPYSVLRDNGYDINNSIK